MIEAIFEKTTENTEHCFQATNCSLRNFDKCLLLRQHKNQTVEDNFWLYAAVAKNCYLAFLCAHIFVSTLPLASLRWWVPRPLARPPAAGNPPPGPEAGSGPASRLLQSEREYVR